MGVREEVVALLRERNTPGEIASIRHVSLATVLGYLEQMVGRGTIRRSDIFFAIPTNRREAIRTVLQNGRSDSRAAVKARLERRGISVPENDIEVVLKYGAAGHALGDLYEDLRAIEVGVHRLIKTALEEEYGTQDNGWWRQGVPPRIRGKCGERRESEDSEPADHPYSYTDLIDLKEIIDKQWKVVSRHLPKTIQKAELLSNFIHVNEVRRMVMHPVRGGIPLEKDFEFLRDLKVKLGLQAISG